MTPAEKSQYIKRTAARIGFSYCGIARAERLDEDARRLETWLAQGFQGQMHYLERHFDLRVDPSKLVPGAKSVITFLVNYFPSAEPSHGAPRISKYAFGLDYHEVIREELKQLLGALREKFGAFQGRGFVDSAPVLERAWAIRSGLGWVGKNGNLITRNSGSFHFIATLITDLDVAFDDPFAKDYCGSCRRCIDACPTDAILENKVVDGSRCISYFTIELKQAMIPAEMQGRFEDWMFGCDTCQDVCPWNRFSRPHSQAAFQPIEEIFSFSWKDWEDLTEEGFRKTFSKSPISRAKFSGIRRNLNFLKNSKTPHS